MELESLNYFQGSGRLQKSIVTEHSSTQMKALPCKEKTTTKKQSPFSEVINSVIKKGGQVLSWNLLLQAFIVLMSCQSFKMLKSLCCFFVLLINILKISFKKHKAKMTHIGQRNQLKAETYWGESRWASGGSTRHSSSLLM